MKTKSINHRIISARITNPAESKGENGNVVRFTAVHHVGDTPLFLSCVMFANKGKKNEREIPVNKLTKGNVLVLEGFDRPQKWIGQDGKERISVDFVVTSISEPEIVEDDAPAAEEEAEGAQE
jgi:single-stranded DNA-binding protein